LEGEAGGNQVKIICGECKLSSALDKIIVSAKTSV
jgi:hypothetical protein